MTFCSRVAAACLLALALVASCSSATGPSEIALYGRYVLEAPVHYENGATTFADTLLLGPDSSLVRIRVTDMPGPLADVYSYGAGAFSVRGRSVTLRFVCMSGGCFLPAILTLNATAVRTMGVVTRLIVEEDDRQKTFIRLN